MPDVAPPAEWTFLLYMDSPDDVQLAADEVLLKRLADAKWGLGSFNLIYDIGVKDVRKRGRIIGGKAPECLETVPQAGSIAEAITSFVDWGQDTFPSRFTALSLRDHGALLGPEDPLPPFPRSRNWLVPHSAAPRSSPGRDPVKPFFTGKVSGNGGDRRGHALDGRGIRTALLETKKQRVDVYCFDACSMGMLEFAYEVRKVTKYFVAAELIIQVDDFPYEAAIAYATTGLPSSPIGMATGIAAKKSELFAVVDTGWLDPLADAVGDLGKQLNAQPLEALLALRNQLRPTADSGVDLKKLLDAITLKVPGNPEIEVALVKQVAKALKRAMPSNDALAADTAGLALSFPEATTIGYMLGYGGLTFGRENDWARFLFDYIPMCVDKYIYTSAQNAAAVAAAKK